MSKAIMSIRLVAPVGSGKTHVAETIRKALEAEYGGRVDIALTDIAHDTNCGELSAPPKEMTFKIIEDHGKR